MNTADRLEVLGSAKYLQLTTFRRTGVGVPTPVWVVRSGDELWIWSNPQAGKVRRIRNDPAVTVAPCTLTGTVTGDASTGRARLLDRSEVPALERMILGKYGISGRLSMYSSRLTAAVRRRPSSRFGLAVALVG